MTITAIRKKRIAIVGSGISGLSCAWLLNKAHDVTLFEKDDRLGGHSNTVDFQLDGQEVNVDTGFIVFNPVNYPNLVKLFDLLNVDNCETEMSFAVSINKGKLEYSGTNINGLLAQKLNIFRPSFWKMITDLLRFYRESDQMLESSQLDSLTLGQLLDKHGYGKHFIYNHLLPMGAAIWSTPVDQMLHYPAGSFLRFCKNHGLIQLKDRPQWRTVIGGSKNYVHKLANELEGRIKLNSRIHRIIREPDQVIIEDHHGNAQYFDEVVLACHSDQALALLEQPTSEEEQLLGDFPYQRNIAYLHMDENLMPKRKAAWSSWNYLSEGRRDQSQQVSLTYWMNKLQPLKTDRNLFVSLNPLHTPEEGSIVRTFFYDHPTFGKNSHTSQKKLWQLQGKHRTWFCGAYFGHGFHEDGLQAGLAVAEQLGGLPRPWKLDDNSSRIFVGPQPSRQVTLPEANRQHA